MHARVVWAQTADKLSDAEIVRRAKEGDRWAEEVLFRRHVQGVAKTVTRLLGSQSDTEDVIQDTFIAALHDLDKLRDPTALKPWLMQIAVRKVHRRFRRRKLLRVLGLDRSIEDAALDRLAATGASPEVLAELALLDRKLAGLPARERIPWMLRFVEGASLPEVAMSCDCSLTTIKRRIASAQKKLKVHLTDEVSSDD